MQYHFEQVDVFTKKRFAGNPLAVFTEAQGLSPEDMQRVAREMNLSETTFVVPSTIPDCVARYIIFTPDDEMPFAGHPTVGTAYVLARLGKVPSGSNTLNLEAKVGKVAVRVEGPSNNPTALFFTSPPIVFGSRCDNRAAVADALGLRESDLLATAPVEEAGCPVLHPYVGLASPELVDSVTVNEKLFVKAMNEPKTTGVYIFASKHETQGIYARFFSFTKGGTIEDPATGSAASPLAAYLLRHGLLAEGNEFVVEQGTKMGRQSFLTVSLTRRGRSADKIEVGGSAVSVLSGTLVM